MTARVVYKENNVEKDYTTLYLSLPGCDENFPYNPVTKKFERIQYEDGVSR